MKELQKGRFYSILLAFSAAGLLTLLAWAGLLSTADRAVSDAWHRDFQATDGDIVLVGVDQRALEEIGPYEQWGRDIMVMAVEYLNESEDCRPAAIALDVLYTGEKEPDTDAWLAEAAKEYANVIVAPNALAAEASANTVQLAKTEGTVIVSNSRKRAVSLIEKMRIYSGYHLGTKEASYAATGADGTLVFPLPTPTLDGYTFDGWFTALDGREQVTPSTVFTTDGSITAQWTRDEYWHMEGTTLYITGVMNETYGADGNAMPWKAGEITRVVISDGVPSIGMWAFTGCTNLTDATIPDSVTDIGKNAFRSCSSLTSVTIPSSVTAISQGAFYACNSLTDVYYGGTKSQWDSLPRYPDNDLLYNAHIHYKESTVTFNANSGAWYAISGPANAGIPNSAVGHCNSTLSLTGLSTRSTASSAVRAAARGSDPGYTDVPDGAWYAEAVAYCREHGLMVGTSAAEFSPDDTMTRAMMVTVLHRLAGTPPAVEAASFPDVGDGTWYTEAVSWASREKIILGYPDGTFWTGDPVTHEQVALIFQRYSGDPNVQTIGADTPKSPATRAEIASALMDFATGQTLAPGTLSVFSAMNIMCAPSGIAEDRDGSFLVTDVYHKQIWRVLHRASESYAGGATV